MKFNWGIAIVLGFILFAAFVFTLITKMLGSGSDLLASDNYHSAAEINRDLKLLAASARFKKTVVFEYKRQRNAVMIRFPQRVLAAEVRLTCLSRAGADHRFFLNLQRDSAGSWFQEEKIPAPSPGYWLAEIRGRTEKDSFLIREKFRGF